MLLAKWPARARNLALALTIHEERTGPNGFAIDEELDPDMDGWFEGQAVPNYATKAREDFLRSHPDLEPGTSVIVIKTAPEDGDEDGP